LGVSLLCWLFSRRLAGSGGLFGYYGLFQTSKLGRSNWYLTNRQHSVVVITASRTVLLSPDDADGFLAAVRQSAPVAMAVPGAPFPDASIRTLYNLREDLHRRAS